MAYTRRSYSSEDGKLFEVKEAYRTIRTNLMFSVAKAGCKVVVFSSAIQGEGKTTTAANVAFSIARNNNRVLLIDMDLRRPRVHRLLKLSSVPGLTNFLGGFNSIEEVLHRGVYPNLDVICAGTIPPNPSELVASANMATFLTELQKGYDFIIIDSPPVGVVSDALPLLSLVDGMVLVVRSRFTNHKELKKVIDQVNFIHGKILGVVMNGVQDEKRGSGYRKGYYRRYGYGYGYGYGSYKAAAAQQRDALKSMEAAKAEAAKKRAAEAGSSGSAEKNPTEASPSPKNQ